MNNKDIYLDLLRKLELNPEYTQRELSKEMGISLGKVNYCIKKWYGEFTHGRNVFEFFS